MSQVHADSVKSGDICAIIGLEGFEIGDTVSDPLNPDPLPRIAIDEPTMSMLFTINDSPFFGKDGKFVTSRHINERLQHELQKNLALRVEKTEREDAWNVFGRGVLHLSVLIEEMRREGYELQVGQPQVIVKMIDGVKCEPIESLTINVPEEYSSKMIDMVTRRKGEMTMMEPKTTAFTSNLKFLLVVLSVCVQMCLQQVLAKRLWLTDSSTTNHGRAISCAVPTALSLQWKVAPPMPTLSTNCKTAVNSLSSHRKMFTLVKWWANTARIKTSW